MKNKEIVSKNGRLFCPMGSGRVGIRQPVFLVTVLDAQGKIVRSFFRVVFDGQVVESESRHELTQKVYEAFEQNAQRQWFRFLIPAIGESGMKDPFMLVVADACMAETFEAPVQGKTRGTRIRHADPESRGGFLQESEPAVGGSFRAFIPDTPENRRILRDIRRELTMAVRRTEHRTNKLVERFMGKSAPEQKAS